MRCRVAWDADVLRMPWWQGGASGPYRTTTDEDSGLYHTAKDPLEVDEDGIEMSSAPVALGHASRHGKDVVRRAMPICMGYQHDADAMLVGRGI